MSSVSIECQCPVCLGVVHIKCQAVQSKGTPCPHSAKYGKDCHSVCGIHNKKFKYSLLPADFDGSIGSDESILKVQSQLYSDVAFKLVFTKYISYRQTVTKMGGRCNFPEYLSESLIAKLIDKHELGATCTKASKGDLLKKIGDKITRVECKCATSVGPTSFGPTEEWDELYLLKIDATSLHCKLIRVDLSNTDEIFRAIKVSKAETFGDQCHRGIRPRLSMNSLLRQICKQHKTVIYSGTDLLESYIDRDKLRQYLEVDETD